MDAAISAFGIAAIGAVLLGSQLPPHLDAATTGQLLYAIGDLVFVGFLAAVALIAQTRSTPAFMFVGSGAALLAIGDSIYVWRIGAGSLTPGPMTSLAWPLGVLALALAPTLPARTTSARTADTTRTAMSLLAAAACLPIVVLGHQENAAAVVLAVLGLSTVVARLSVSLRDHQHEVMRADRELAERRRAQAQLAEVAGERDAILRSAAQGIYKVDLRGCITYVNPAAAEMLGWGPDDLLGRPAHETLHHTREDGTAHPPELCPILLAAHRTEPARCDDIFWRRDGSSMPVAYVVAPITTADAEAGVVCVFTDMTEQRRVEAERDELLARSRAIARTDQLTGLPNRRAWDEEVQKELARAVRRGESVTVGLIDLDRFKAFNDLHGHLEGDRLLREASIAWRMALRDTDFIARYGGEEFGVLLPDCSADEASEVVTRLRAITPAGQTFSAGLAEWNPSESAEAVTARADAALYTAKNSGRDRITHAD